MGEYRDAKGQKMEVLAVKLKRTSSRDRARTMQRNFIADWLSKTEMDAALVAFYGDEKEDWRLSFVKMEYTLDENGKPIKELTPARRYSFLVGVNEPNHTCAKQFLDIVRDDKEEPLISDIEAVFSIDNVTNEFFEEYKKLFIKLKESLDGVIAEDENVRREFEEKGISSVDFSKKLLGQIVFIYFLQKKGWLGVGKDGSGGFREWGTGPKNFLRRLYEGEYGRYDNFFNDMLEPLFYEALAVQRDRDYYSRFNCKIPFLNGGLFEPLNDYDWTGTSITLDNAIFGKILETFDRFNFTVKEDEPLEKEVAVDPEMLGKVFENLLEVKDRKSKGAFYTPREIVHYMCQQSLINYLETNTKIPRDDIERFIIRGDAILDKIIREHDYRREDMPRDEMLPASIKRDYREIDRLLKEIKIVDPAVGSGAFPVGMLNEIVKARNILTVFFPENEREGRNTYALKRETIENSLYGVDIDSSAVEIAKLRFWLSLIVDEEAMRKLEQYRRAKAKPFFIWKLYFFEVFQRENPGFDVVIGNPPYISAVEHSKNSKHEREIYRRVYRQLKGAFDLYVVFLLKTLEIINEYGSYAWIIPNKFLVSEYSEDILEKMKKNGLYATIDVSKYNVFHNVGIYPILILGNKTKFDYMNYTLDKMQDLKNNNLKIRRTTFKFKSFKDFGIKIGSGTTGFQAQQIKMLVHDGSNKTENSIPFAVSGSIDPYVLDRRTVRYMKEKFHYPHIKYDPNVIAKSKWKFWSEPKIIIAGMTKRLESTYIEKPLAIGVGCYAIYDFAGFNPKFLLALLNSSFLTYYLYAKFEDKHLAGGYLAINKSTIEKLPLIEASPEQQQPFISLVDKILSITDDDDYLENPEKQTRVKELERKIDRMVYELYGLTDEEIEVVESFGGGK